jgi:hypothetical protein
MRCGANDTALIGQWRVREREPFRTLDELQSNGIGSATDRSHRVLTLSALAVVRVHANRIQLPNGR